MFGPLASVPTPGPEASESVSATHPSFLPGLGSGLPAFARSPSARELNPPMPVPSIETSFVARDSARFTLWSASSTALTALAIVSVQPCAFSRASASRRVWSGSCWKAYFSCAERLSYPT